MSNPLMELLAAHAGGGAPPGPGGPPGSISVNPADHHEAQGSTDPVDSLKAALTAIHAFVENADDEPDKQTALQCYAKLQSILATEQKEKESALGVTPAHKMMAKATARGGY
jgi:hypothetical protein